jgi:hypothetical protein
MAGFLQGQTKRHGEHSCTASAPITSSPGIGRFEPSIADWCTKAPEFIYLQSIRGMAAWNLRRRK